MTPTVLAGSMRADAFWSEASESVDVVVEMNVGDWRDLTPFERTLPVGGHGDLAVALKVFVWFGAEENFGDGDVDFDDVFLGISIGLTEQYGRRSESVLRIRPPFPKDELAVWHAEPPLGATAGFHNLWRSVSGLFGPQAFHVRLSVAPERQRPIGAEQGESPDDDV